MKYNVYDGFNVQPNEDYNVKEILKKISKDHYKELGEYNKEKVEDQNSKVNIYIILNKILTLIQKMDSYIFIQTGRRDVVFINLNAAVEFNLSNKQLKLELEDLNFYTTNFLNSNVKLTREENNDLIDMLKNINESITRLNKTVQLLYPNLNFPYDEVKNEMEYNLELFTKIKKKLDELNDKKYLIGGVLYKIGYRIPNEYV